MPAIKMCLVFVIDADEGRVLLGRKHRGLGAANLVGLGGHVEPGESARQAAVREAHEEAGITLAQRPLRHLGQVRFRFPFKPGWDQDVAVFAAHCWQGQPAPSEEITPGWHSVDTIPYDAMWDDARYWLPDVLAGNRIDLTVTYSADNATVATVQR